MALPVKDFENYSVTSKHYDSNRVAIGIEVILGALCVGSKRPLKDIHILDAGCGTGNYVCALSPYVKKVTGLELNEGMLSQARRKAAGLGNVELLQGDILSMPFEGGEFDGVICNQVLHHLLPDGDTTGSNVKVFFGEVHRVLIPNGAFIVNTCSREQIHSIWYDTLIPKAAEKLVKRYPTIPQIEQFLRDSGLVVGPSVSLTNEVFFKREQWLNVEGPLHKTWRNAASIFSLASDEELQSALEFWRQTVKEGKAEEYIAKWEERRRAVGTATSIVAYKHS